MSVFHHNIHVLFDKPCISPTVVVKLTKLQADTRRDHQILGMWATQLLWKLSVLSGLDWVICHLLGWNVVAISNLNPFSFHLQNYAGIFKSTESWK